MADEFLGNSPIFLYCRSDILCLGRGQYHALYIESSNLYSGASYYGFIYYIQPFVESGSIRDLFVSTVDMMSLVVFPINI